VCPIKTSLLMLGIWEFITDIFALFPWFFPHFSRQDLGWALVILSCNQS
jgi:hypothetical protein